MKRLLPFMSFFAWAMSSPLAAQTSPVTLAEWSFGTTSFQATSSVQHPALAPASLILSSAGGASLIGRVETVTSTSGFFAQTTNWPLEETPALTLPRTNLRPATDSKVLWASFTLSPNASGDWSGLTLSFRHKAATDLTAPTHARAWISWYEGNAVRTRSSPITALSTSSAAWSKISLIFSNGNDPLPSGTSLGGKSFLVEWQCFGASANSNSLSVDDWTLQATSLTAPLPPTIRTSTLSEARVGAAYQTTVTAVHGTLPYTWSITGGSLPPGLSLNAATGVISGTPTAAGESSFTLRVTDAAAASSSRTIRSNVLASGAIIVLGNTVWADVNQNGLRDDSEPGIAGITLRLFAATADIATATALASTVTSTGGLYAFRNLAPGGYRVVVTPTITYSRTGGSPVAIHNGIDNDNNGLQPGGPGTLISSPLINLGIVNTDNTIDFGLVTAPVATITINPATLPSSTVGMAYQQTLTATGGTAPYTWAVTSGTLPAGLTLTTTGILSGTPAPTTTTTTGTNTFAIRATDALGASGSRTYSMANACAPITLSPTTMPEFTVGMPAAVTMTASGGSAPYVWTISGSLPPGLTLSPNGLLSGTPTTAGTYTASIRVTDTLACTSTRSFAITVRGAASTISINPATLPRGNVGKAYQQTLTATGGTAPYTWAITSGTLPAGLTLTATGIISGTPVGPIGTGTAPSSTFTIQTTDAAGQRALINYVMALELTPLTISPASLPPTTPGTAYMQTFSATGGTAPYTWAVTSGTLPAGLTLSATGIISGTPTSTSTATFAVRATDALGASGSRSYTMTNACATITFSPATMPEFTVGTPAAVTMTASGGSAPYVWTISGSLPPGLTLSPNGLLSGTPTTAGTYTASIRVTDTLACTSTRRFLITIRSAASTISINPATLPSSALGTRYMQTFSASGGTAPYTWAITSGTLPAGLTLSTTGILSGTPTSTGTAIFVIRASDAVGASGSRSYTLSVVSGSSGYPSSFVLWQQQNNLMSGPLGDPDADGLPNLLEYALGTPPNACTGMAGRFALVKSTTTGTSPSAPMIQAELLRPAGGQNDLIFVLEGLGDLAASPTGWRPITVIPATQTTSAGLIKRIWQSLNAANGSATSLLSPERGFIRLRVSLDADLNGSPEASAVTSTYGWLRSSPAAGSSTSLGMPFVLPAVYSSQILAVNGASLALGNSTGNMNILPASFSELFAGGRQFYAEILTGTGEGRRFEIDEALTQSGSSTTASGTTVVLDLASPQNTGAPISSILAGSRVAIRPHWTLGSAFEPAAFLAPPTASTPTGDLSGYHRLNTLNADGSTYTSYLVAATNSGPKWINPAVTTTTDLNGKVIRPDEGHILRVASSTPLTFTLLGQVRETAFVSALTATLQLISNPWPMTLTPSARALTSSSGFVSGTTATTSDNIFTFEGPIGSNVDVLRSYFLLKTNTSEFWQPSNSTDPALLFPPASATFFRPTAARPAWVQPRPWIP